MNPLRLCAVGLLLVLAGLLCWRPPPVLACAAAPPHSTSVAIADESAIIIWDEPSQTEHFIRRASFTTEAKDFGFLVPTPTQPSLAEASDEAFTELAKITAPKVVKQQRPASGGCLGCPGAAPGNKVDQALPGVAVVDSGRVSGFVYTVLEATDADELSKWLDKHQYDFSPALKEWAKHYIDAKWLITAFKVDKGSDGKTIATKAVRMTFKTPQPYFPYREPETKPPEPDQAISPKLTPPPSPTRLLRIFFLSSGRVKGALGKDGEAWPGTVAWSNKIEPSDREKILDLVKLPKESPPATWWLTDFEDHSSPRPGKADLWFSPTANEPVERPPHIQYVAISLPDCVMSYALVAYLLLPGLVRRVARFKRR
jgi:hypothetical protein